jgi:hypothetical protein
MICLRSCGISIFMSGRTRLAYRWWHEVIAWVILAVVDSLFAVSDAIASVRAMFFYRPTQLDADRESNPPGR